MSDELPRKKILRIDEGLVMSNYKRTFGESSERLSIKCLMSKQATYVAQNDMYRSKECSIQQPDTTKGALSRKWKR